MVRVIEQDTELTSGNMPARFFGGILLGLFVLLGTGYGVDYFLSQGTMPRGTMIGGVQVGGMKRAEAKELLQKELADEIIKPVTITAGQRTSIIDPRAAGLRVNWDKTLDSVESQSLNPIKRILGFFKDTEVPIVSDADPANFRPAVDRVTKELSPAPVAAGLVLTGGQVKVDPAPADGQTVDAEQVEKSILTGWLKPGGVKEHATISHPKYGEKQVQPIVDGPGKKAVSAPLVLHGRDNINGEIPVDRMGEVVTFRPENDEFKIDFNYDRAREIFAAKLITTAKPRVNANITFHGSDRTVTPHSDGVHIDWVKTFDHINERIIADDPRTWDATYIDEPASFTTEMANAATFDQVVGEFTTGGYSQASGVNIARVAEMVDGAMVAPGDTFSLNGYTGPRGTAQGFVESGIIMNGHADKAVGGGISQFATTLYNAAYFGGMEDVTHTPHSYYISRYPAGREATVFEGAIDLAFKNTSQYPVRIVTSAGGGQVTVKLMGVKVVNVESVNGGRWATTQPNTISLSGKDCSPSSGAPGFTTSDTRIVKDLNGNELSRKTTTTVYNPSPIVRCT